MLYVGYYEALEDSDIEATLFIKKHLNFQMRFYNIHVMMEKSGKSNASRRRSESGSSITADIGSVLKLI